MLALFLALTLLPAVAGDEDPPRTSLELDATARLTQVGPAGRQSVQLILKARNRSDVASEIERGTLLLEHGGGWLTPLAEEPAERIFRAPIVVQPGAARVLADRAYVTATPATQLLVRLTAADGGAALTVPILRDGQAAPPRSRDPAGFDVGVAGPLEALPFSDGTTGVLLVGQHQLFGGTATDLVTTVTVGSDQGGLEPITWKGFDAQGDRGALWPFVRRVQVIRGFEQGRLQIIARVANSGDSSEPHLHFMAYRIDASGRARAVPVTFSDAWHDAKATQPVAGVPLAGAEYTFRAAR